MTNHYGIMDDKTNEQINREVDIICCNIICNIFIFILFCLSVSAVVTGSYYYKQNIDSVKETNGTVEYIKNCQLIFVGTQNPMFFQCYQDTNRCYRHNVNYGSGYVCDTQISYSINNVNMKNNYAVYFYGVNVPQSRNYQFPLYYRLHPMRASPYVRDVYTHNIGGLISAIVFGSIILFVLSILVLCDCYDCMRSRIKHNVVKKYNENQPGQKLLV